MNRLGTSAVVLLSLAAAAVACGEDRSGSGSDSGDVPFRLPLSDTTYDVDAPTWAVDDTVHVGEEEVTLDPAPQSYVVAEHGIYYTADLSLYFADNQGTEEVGPIGSSEIVKSPDSRYLGVIDEAHGPTDDNGTQVAVPVVFDLSTGDEVLRPGPGPGRSQAGQDLADLYEEAEPRFRGFADGAAYAFDPLRSGETRFPLDGGEPQPVSLTPDGVAQLPRFGGQLGFDVNGVDVRGGGFKLVDDTRDPSYFAALSPGEEFLINLGVVNRGSFSDATTGERFSFDPGLRTFTLGGWIDDDRFYGATSADGSLDGPSGTTQIVACETGSRECTPLSERFELPRPTLLFATGSTYAR